MNDRTLTVSELNGIIKALIDSEPLLGRSVFGESCPIIRSTPRVTTISPLKMRKAV